MNKEEQLLQEAVEYVSNYEGYGWTPHEGSPVFYAMVYSYIAGAESRENGDIECLGINEERENKWANMVSLLGVNQNSRSNKWKPN